MRIVIDLQGAQASNANRGIGRYSLSLARAIASNRGSHEVIIALNGLFPDSIEPIRAAFKDILPQENIRLWSAPGPVSDIDISNTDRRNNAEWLREAFLASLVPDIVLISSLFEGLGDDAITSIGRLSQAIPTAVILYDLIPFIYPDIYLENQAIRKWYSRKLDHLRRADLYLSISESSRQEGIRYLGFSNDKVVNISCAADGHFQKRAVAAQKETKIRKKYALLRPFIMYTGGIDHRKNIDALIRSFARLPENVRHAHQLVIVCSIQAESRESINALCVELGLNKNDVVLTGYVTEDDLIALYNLCKVFVFPSWHEGFGLPALEAMHCGAAVIASNTSSLPEVIGCQEALFDPHTDEEISEKLLEVLSDEVFRKRLSAHGLIQSSRFSWERTAKLAISAIERFVSAHESPKQKASRACARLKLAYVSPLPPARSGIADYSAELLPELSKYYDIDVIVAQRDVSDHWVDACVPIRSIDWFLKNGNRYHRVIYHFGNSIFHEHMFDLLEQIPGVVVLHDFFLSGIQAHRDVHGLKPGAWTRSLYHSHGYAAVRERFHARDTADVIFKYPCNLDVIQNACGVIVHSAASLRLANRWYRHEESADWATIPLLRVPAMKMDKTAARRRLGLDRDDFIVCSFGILGPTKQNQRLLNAWINSALAHNSNCKLIFVGENQNDTFGLELSDRIHNGGFSERIHITGWVDSDKFRDYLLAADMAVQLRALSRGETSAAVLDCMNYGLPTIVNANGSMADLPSDAVWMLTDEFADADIIRALETLWQDNELRHAVGKRARNTILIHHSPSRCASQYATAIESFYLNQHVSQNLFDTLGNSKSALSDKDSIGALAAAISQNVPPKSRTRQMFVDVSELVQRDAKSGIQRVTRSILNELLINPPSGFKVEPVFASADEIGYRYARSFTLNFLDCPQNTLMDEPIEAYPEDIFVGLDLQPQIVPVQTDYLLSLRQRGVYIYFVVYDLLPIFLPHAFFAGAGEGHTTWLKSISQFDGALCISRSVADELIEWLQINNPARHRPFNIGWFHLGADVENSVPTKGLANIGQALVDLESRPSFLMVGTLEPRKGHAQTLAAFEVLWSQGIQINLVIVGKQGWMIEAFVEKLRQHPELGKRLFWFDNISDEFLEKIYTNSRCLILASEGEGFGLPLIEAARYGLPIIVRDIPVFREVADEHAFYFSGLEKEDLASAVEKWLSLSQSSDIPQSSNMKIATWKESTEQLLRIFTEKHWYKQFMPDSSLRFWGGDFRLSTQIGKRVGRDMNSTGNPGYLIYGPYIPMAAGEYCVSIRGRIDKNKIGVAARMDVAVEKGNYILGGAILEDGGSDDCLATVNIELDVPCTDLEVRVVVENDSRVTISMIEIKPSDLKLGSLVLPISGVPNDEITPRQETEPRPDDIAGSMRMTDEKDVFRRGLKKAAITTITGGKRRRAKDIRVE